MKKRFTYKKTLFMNILLIGMTILSLIMATVSVFKFFNLFGFSIGNLSFDIASVVFLLLTAVVLIGVATCKYVMKENVLRLKFLWFDIAGRKMEIKHMQKLVFDTSAEKLYANFILESGCKIIHVCIDAKHVEKFVETVKKIDNNIIFEEVTGAD